MRDGRKCPAPRFWDSVEPFARHRPRSFLTDFYVTVARWIDWATTVVETWPDDVIEAPFDTKAAEEGVARAEEIEQILRR